MPPSGAAPSQDAARGFRRPRPESALLLLGLAVFSTLLFKHLSYPLLWQDEAETVMFGTRIVEYGYPKVHGERNVVYEFGPNVALGVNERFDAYIGKTWGDFYFAVPGLLWARGTDDPYDRTFRLRLPFALAGAAGLAVMLFSVWQAIGRRDRLPFAAAFVALCSVSVSLLLHLREVRYYPLLVLVLGAVLALHLRRLLAPSDRFRGYALAQGASCFLLFHVAWLAATSLLVLDAAHRAWRRAAGRRARWLARELAPHALAALALLPWILFLEIFEVARGFAAHVGVSLAGYAANLGQVFGHFARHELLVPALVCSIALALTRGRASGTVPARRVSLRLAAFCLGYAAIGCLNPLVYERYFVVLGPLVTLIFLLDAFLLVDRARGSRAVPLAIVLLLAAALVPRAGAIRGRLAELREPVRGPLDFAIAHLRERYADTAPLVIATNYEAHPLMYYLGSHVVVGLSANNIMVERALVPDVVIPRRAWPRNLPELQRFLARGEYRMTALPVLDTHYNNISALSRSASTPDPHRFVTPTAGGAGRLRVFHRVSGDSTPGDVPP